MRFTRVRRLAAPDLVEGLTSIIEGVQAKGLRVPANCRLSRHLSFLRNWSESSSPGIVQARLIELRSVMRAAIDLNEYVDILNELDHDMEEWREKLEISLGGQPLPGKEKKTTARDAQFELFLAASLRRAGYRVHPFPVVDPTKGCPDLLARRGPFEFAIEAKRVGSRESLDKRIKEAFGQLVGGGRCGYIAIEASRLLNKSDNIVSYRGFYAETSPLFNSLCELEASCDKTISALQPREQLLGIIWRASLGSSDSAARVPQIASSFYVSCTNRPLRRDSTYWTLAHRLANRDRSTAAITYLND